MSEDLSDIGTPVGTLEDLSDIGSPVGTVEDLSDIGTPLDSNGSSGSDPAIPPDDFGPMDEIQGLGRAVKRGGIRAAQAFNTVGVVNYFKARSDLDKAKAELGQFDSMFGGKPDPTGSTQRQRLNRISKIAELENEVSLRGEQVPELVTKISEEQKAIQALPVSAGVDAFNKIPSGDILSWGKEFLNNPFEIATSAMAESVPLSVPGMALGTAMAGPVGTALGAGAGSFAAEYSTSILDSLQNAGIDISKPNWDKSVTDEQIEKAIKLAIDRGVPVAILDAISGGLAGKIAGPLIGKGLGKTITGVAGEGALGAGSGMLGEAGAQLNSGQPLDLRDIAMEGIAEGPSSIYEAGKNIIEARPGASSVVQGKVSGQEGATPDFSKLGNIVEDSSERSSLDAPERREFPSANDNGSGQDNNRGSVESQKVATVSDVRQLLEEYLAGGGRSVEQVQPPIEQPVNQDIPQTEEAAPVEVNQNLAKELQDSINRNQLGRQEPKPSELQSLPESVGNSPAQRNQPTADEQGVAPSFPDQRPEPIQRAPEQRPQPVNPEVNTRPEGPTEYERLTGKPSDFARQDQTPIEPSKREAIAPDVERVAAKLPGAVPYEIVQSTSQLPKEAQRPDAQAVFHNGKVWLVADNLPNSQEAIRKYFHEQVGHHGVRIVLGDEFTPIMRSVFSRYSGTSVMEAVAKTYDLDLKQDADRTLAAEEIVARIAENPELNPTLWNRIVTAFKKAWRKLTGADISEDEIRDIVRRAYRQIEREDVGMPYDEEGARFSQKEQDMDSKYLDAVNRGDTETAQKMVDEAAKKAGYDLSVFHGTGVEKFNVFRDWLPNFFTTSPEYAEGYVGGKKTKDGQVLRLLLSVKKPFDTRIPEHRKIFNNEFLPWVRDKGWQKDRFGNGAELASGELLPFTKADVVYPFLRAMKREGKMDFDGYLVDEKFGDYPPAIVPLNPSQIKSADPVVKDDSGAVIPLSKRFNRESNDIRYSLPPKFEGKTKPGEGEDSRRFMRQVQSSSDLDPTIKERLENYTYTVRSSKTDAAFAAEMVNDLGVDKAMEVFRNREADIPGAIRTRLGNSIIKELGRQERQARMDLDFKKADELVRKSVDFIDFDTLNRSTDLGQSVQAFNDFSYLTPGGWLSKAKRVIDAAQGKAPKKKKPFIKKAKKELDNANKGAAPGVIDDTLDNDKAQGIIADNAIPEGEDKKASRKTAKQQLDIWSRYKVMIANSMKPVVQGMIGAKPPSPALQGFSNRVTAVLRAQLEQGKAKDAPALSDIQVIAEALTNPEKYQEAWLKVGEVLSEKYKDNPAAMELLEARLSLDPELVTNSRLDRAVAKKLKELNLKISDIIRKHYMEAAASTRLLSDKLIQEAGLSGDQALQLAKLVTDRMADVTKERKTKAIEQLIKAKDGASPKEKKALAEKVLELSNLGVFTEEAGVTEAAKLLGVPALTEEQKAEIYRMADDLQLLPDDSVQRTKATMALMNYIAKASGRKFYDLPLAFWYANVLSGPITHIYNAISNTLSVGGNMAATLARQPLAIPAATKALVTGLRKGVYDAAETMRSGKQNPDIKFENINQLELLDDKDLAGTARLLKHFRYVSRAMMAADQLFFASAKEAKATILARGIAKEEGLRGDALDVRVRQILGEDTRQKAEAQATTEGLQGIEYTRRVNELVSQEMEENVGELAGNFARLSTYNNAPYGLLGAIARALNAINRETVVSRVVVPFVNIAANVTNESLNYSPIGAIRAAVAHRSLRKTGEATLHGNEIESLDPVLDAYSKAALGTLMLGAIVAAHVKYQDDDDPWFALNGAGPKDWRKRRALTETGWKQYTLKVGKRYISFKDSPFAIPLGVAANYLDAVKYGKLEEEDLHNRLGYAMMQIPHVIVQQSFLDSLANLLGAVDRSSEKGAGDRALEQIARSSTSIVVPNALKQIDRLFDPSVYESDDIKSMLQQQIPFVRRYGKPALNALGEPVTSSPLKRFGSVETEDTLWRDLGRKYALPSPPGQGLLKDDEYYDLIKERGPRLRQALESRISSINLSTPSEAKKIVNSEAVKATKQAKQALGLDVIERNRRLGIGLEEGE